MTNEKLSSIIIFASDKKLNGEKFKKICDKGCDILNREYDRGNQFSLGRLIDLPRLCVLGIRGVYHEYMDSKNRELIASKLFNVPRDEVTGNLVNLTDSIQNYSVFVNDLRYTANIFKENLESLNVIWGNADLRALDDFKYVKNLNVVMGNIYMSEKTEGFELLDNLEVVTGDVYAERLSGLEPLTKLQYVGGKIYNKGNVYTLDELKDNKKNIKKL